MKTGDLRKQIALQQEHPTADGAGGYTLGWTTMTIVWGDIAPVTGREIYTAGHLEGHVTHKITLRWRSDITVTTDMRLIYNNRAFNICAVMNKDEANQWLEILAEEGTAT